MKDKTKNILLFLFYLTLLIVDIIIPDPLPFVDELILGYLTGLTAIKIKR